MESTQTIKSAMPEDDDLSHATVRELIVQLALVEDERRKATNPGQIAALAGASKQSWSHCTGMDSNSKALVFHICWRRRPPFAPQMTWWPKSVDDNHATGRSVSG